MPRKKRVLQQRSAGDGAASTSGLYRPDEFQPIADDILPGGIIRNSFAIGEDIHPAECLRNIQEMFDGKLDADVIHMVLTECEFNVNNALEALFTLLPQESGASAPSVIYPRQASNLSPSTSSESIGAGENIVTSEAEVHKSSEEKIQETCVSELSSEPRDKIPLEPPLEVHQNPSTSSSEKTSTAAPEETISLGDLIALVQNDSEESGSRSRQNSDSWSSGHDGNDSEDGTERDDDFLWTSRKALSSLTEANVPVNEAILEESDAPEQETSHRLETELEEIKEEPECADTVVETVTEAWPDVIDEKEVVDLPKPPRDSPRHLGGLSKGR
ncbi:hypothetical protein MTO96_021807 [Rhipicephalus appendiculatus]